MNALLSEMFSLEGKVTLIVGAAGCIGRKIAESFSALSATIALADIQEAEIHSIERELQKNQRTAAAFVTDITDKKSVEAMTNQVIKSFDRIDILINCAGLSYIEEAISFDEDKWDKLMEVNIKGVFLTCQLVGKHMIKNKWGRIVNFSSVRGIQGRAKDLAYAPSKGAVNQLTRSLAIEWAPFGINVNAIAPTFIRTNLNEDLLNNGETFDWVLGRIPKQRICEIHDLIPPLVFLCSPGSDFITGHILYVDGGWTAA